MRKKLVGTLLFCSISVAAFAVLIPAFMDTDTFIERAKEIVVAECVSTLKHETVNFADGWQMVEVNILKVLKGNRNLERSQIATIYPMKPHTTYMLHSLGGSTLGTDFVALSKLSVVPLPATFKLDELKGKELKEQVQYMFSRRLYEVERKLAPLLKQKELLEKSVSDRRYEWFKSDEPVKIGPIVEVSTQTDGRFWLDLKGRKLKWSEAGRGKSGYFYFEKMDAPWAPYWEFSPCDVAKIEDLSGKPLKARFYGLYTPGRGETPPGWKGRQAIGVEVGQVLLARTIDEPQNVFVIQIVGQKQDQEQMSARYSVIQN